MIGEMRERAAILRPQRVPDGGGGYAVDYAPVAEIAVGVESRSAARDRLTGAEARLRRRRFLMRRRSDLIFEMRIVHQDTTYRITDIRDASQGRLSLVDGEEIRT